MRVILFLLFFLYPLRASEWSCYWKDIILRNNQPVKDYESVLQEIAIKRKEFSKQSSSFWNRHHSCCVEEVLVEKRSALTFTNAWEGTPWDFNGHTRYPQQGKYMWVFFVTTMLCDMGMHIDRVKLVNLCLYAKWWKRHAQIRKFKTTGRMGAEEMNNYLNTKVKLFILPDLIFMRTIVSDDTGNWFIHLWVIGLGRCKRKNTGILARDSKRYGSFRLRKQSGHAVTGCDERVCLDFFLYVHSADNVGEFCFEAQK